MARLFAIGTFQSIDERFHLKVNSPDQLRHWDTLMLVGGVTVALSCLRERVTADGFMRLFSRVCRELDRYDPIGSRALEDCIAFIERSVTSAAEPRVSAEDALGMWVLWNLYGRFPTLEESAPASAIGGLLSHTFSEWWSP